MKVRVGGVVDAEHDDNDIGGESQSILARLGGGPRPERNSGDGGGAIDAEIAGEKSPAGQAFKNGGVGIASAVGDLVAVGDAIADTGDTHGWLGSGKRGHGDSKENGIRQAVHG